MADDMITIYQSDIDGRLAAAYWDGHKQGGLDTIEAFVRLVHLLGKTNYSIKEIIIICDKLTAEIKTTE